VIAMEPRGKGIMGTLLRYPYEIRDEHEYFDQIPDLKLGKDTMDLAKHIVETKRGDFEPEKFEDRYEAALFAERSFGPQLHLLDDGFQHRALARDFDIVLVTPEDARDRLLPAGRLREPLNSLSRADAVVLASGASPESFALQGKLLWRVRRGISLTNAPTRPIVFCGIARPQNFLLQLRTAGVEPVAQALYRDHHQYSERDIQDLLKLRQQSQAEGFVTTEKDAINLGGYLHALQPLTVIPVRMELVDAANAVDTMLAIVAERRARREKIGAGIERA